ncbi:sucrose transport protein SUC3 [Momordica charantia]|uniref:Sucrose transport protein SUC3 n=1 Tax=Momordica charantia TaxID=3673 RepID=A0A6J1DXD1_MOMCH|nr:sucrose transport protein SUC3 [Momordica charantia]
MSATPNSVSFRVPYKNLQDAEVEMVAVDEHQLQRIDLNSPPSDRYHSGSPESSSSTPPVRSTPNSLFILILSCTIAAGVQFGWALQLSLLTPYIQTLGIEHAFSSFIWLCGPITGLVVQPCVGIWSDKCSSKYGRRRPFILAGSLMIAVAVVLIGYSADIGYFLGDTKEHCRVFKGTRTRAAIVFVIGFWMLDLANNTVQGPARALLADLSGYSLPLVVLGISSFFIEPMCQRMGARLVWAMSNFIVFACMMGTTIISLISVSQYSKGIEHIIGGNSTIKNAALVVFALLGFPLAITYSVPFSLTAELTADSGGGQGLAIGVLNLAVVIPQMIVSLGAGPWDALFNGGNIPAFALASICAFAAGVVAVLRLPKHTTSSFKSTGFHFG